MSNKHEVNYKNQKRYKTAKYPIRQPIFFVWLIWILSKILLIGKKYKVKKINMEGLKPPYILLSNHQYFVDFELTAIVTHPHRVNNVVNIDGFYRRPWLLELIGAICTRKFTNDLHLIKSIRKVIDRGDILAMYPEARYSASGTTAYMPESLGMLVKRCKVPVVAVVHHGNHLHTPFWNFRKPRKVPLYTTATQILTAEDVAQMSSREIYEKIVGALQYDEYAYQREMGIKITEPYRAEGLHKILYQCPKCNTESKMASEGAEIYCTECGKRWTLLEDGTLSANDGETEFSRVPDWYEWERSRVIEEVMRGEYSFQDDVRVYSLPRCWRFEYLGDAKIRHNAEEGFVLEGTYRGKEYRVQRLPLENNSLHIEYDYCYIEPYDCFDLSTLDDSFYCYPTKQNVVTKLGFATEAIYQMKLKEAHADREG